MARMLSRVPVLCALAIATIALHAAIHLNIPDAGGSLMDFKLTGAGARALLETLQATPDQLAAHIHITAVLDMAYPVAYAPLVAGLCLRYGAPRFAILALLAGACDIAENMVQIMALTGSADLLIAKTVLTPAKFILIAAASLAAITLWTRASLRN